MARCFAFFTLFHLSLTFSLITKFLSIFNREIDKKVIRLYKLKNLANVSMESQLKF